MKRAGWRRWVLVPAVLLGAACARIPVTHYYVLQPGGEPAAAGDASVAAGTHAGGGSALSLPASGLDIAVDPFQVDPPYDQDRLVYRVGAHSPEVAFYAYHRWAVPLSRMLPGMVAAVFRRTNGVRSVEPALPGREYGARLGGRVMTFEEVDTPGGAAVRFRIRLVLHGGDGAEIWSETVAGGRATQAREVGDLVVAMGAAVSQALENVLPSFESALRP